MPALYNCKILSNPSAKVRIEPSTSNTSTTGELLYYGTLFQISAIVPDMDDPTNPAKKWGKIEGGIYHGKFTALEYTSSPYHMCDYTLIETPIPSEEIKITGSDIYYIDPKTGVAMTQRMVADGAPFPTP